MSAVILLLLGPPVQTLIRRTVHRGRALSTLLLRISDPEARQGQKPPWGTGTRLGVEPRWPGDSSALLTLPAQASREQGPVQEPEGKTRLSPRSWASEGWGRGCRGLAGQELQGGGAWGLRTGPDQIRPRSLSPGGSTWASL